MPDRCRSCKAEIRWATTAAGHLMPINPEPDTERGNLRLERLGVENEIPRVLIVPAKYRIPGEPLFSAHRQTCQFADRRLR